MRDYKGWTGKQRKESLKLTNKAKELGWIKLPTCCNRCGQTKGILQLHNEDYSVTYNVLRDALDRFPAQIKKSEMKKVAEVLEELCWRCHMIHHSTHRNPQACENYFNEIKAGKQYPPVYRHNFDILKYEHNIW
ncbi:MAG: hypothetical protein Unbinned805contig1001_9 [Prokaryotic dsDNA virus sp.]|jgi:hypothetical protein|nr:MAG: hypothetical protein Unbinned805contig1001_9 [Prokaryotic dsDNA virus sp.]|tara:strand:- start:256 stop:657 length:402 start_codon:yes stop_codon:yes gene_type:complete